ncbi:MAG TPA: phasin family protein [Noviherbaspirillum sp.]|nr:phasin family protein [Noviherbaspirillum sp.]
MLANHDGASRAAREQVSWQLEVGTMLGDALMQAMRQYAELNMGMLRATLEQGNLAARQLVVAQDARQFLSLSAAQVQPGVLRGLDYGYYLATIIAGLQSGVVRICAVVPDTASERGPARFADPDGWMAAFSSLKALTESAFRFPADTARAVRLALNLDTPAWETGKLRIAYTGPGR